MESKAPAIADYLLRHYPCEALPHGALTIVSEKFGVTRERVRQVAKGHGFIGFRQQPAEDRVVQRRKNGRALCPSCGNPTSNLYYTENRVSRTLCKACKYIEIACTNCGKMKVVSAATYTRHANSNAPVMNPTGKPAKYTGRVFCNRKCFGQWASRTGGFAAHPENAKKRQAIIRSNNQSRVREALPGTIHDICGRTWFSHQTVRKHLDALMAEGTVKRAYLHGNAHTYALKEQG